MVCGNRDGTYCGPVKLSVLNAKTGYEIKLPSKILSIEDSTITLTSKSTSDVGKYNYKLKVSLLLYPNV